MSSHTWGLPLPKAWILAAISTLVLVVRVQASSVYPSNYERRRLIGLPSYTYQTEEDLEPIRANSRGSLLKDNPLLVQQEYTNRPQKGGGADGLPRGYPPYPLLMKEEFNPSDNQIANSVEEETFSQPQITDSGRYKGPIAGNGPWSVVNDSSVAYPLDRRPVPSQVLLAYEGGLGPWMKGVPSQDENLEWAKAPGQIPDLEFRRKREIKNPKKEGKIFECPLWFRMCSFPKRG